MTHVEEFIHWSHKENREDRYDFQEPSQSLKDLNKSQNFPGIRFLGLILVKVEAHIIVIKTLRIILSNIIMTLDDGDVVVLRVRPNSKRRVLDSDFASLQRICVSDFEKSVCRLVLVFYDLFERRSFEFCYVEIFVDVDKVHDHCLHQLLSLFERFTFLLGIYCHLLARFQLETRIF